jgi:hypothetical protein
MEREIAGCVCRPHEQPVERRIVELDAAIGQATQDGASRGGVQAGAASG